MWLLSKRVCGKITEKFDAVLREDTKVTIFPFELSVQAGAAGFTSPSRGEGADAISRLDRTSSSFNSVLSIRDTITKSFYLRQ